MGCLIFLCISLSILNLYLILRNSHKQISESDHQEFRKLTETLITEFNRITTRNISMLDSYIEELNQKIQVAQKIKTSLTEKVEKILKEKLFSDLPLDNKSEICKTKYKRSYPVKTNTILDKETNKRDKFDGFLIDKLQKYKDLSVPQKKISKEELTNLGFSNNEINLILLSADKKSLS